MESANEEHRYASKIKQSEGILSVYMRLYFHWPQREMEIKNPIAALKGPALIAFGGEKKKSSIHLLSARAFYIEMTPLRSISAHIAAGTVPSLDSWLANKSLFSAIQGRYSQKPDVRHR